MQVVGYEPSGAGASILLADGGAVERRPLDAGDRLAFSLGDRHCAGTVDGDAHVSCDDPGTPYCPAHTSTWVCARCTGTCLKDEMDCYEDHAVYLAAFAPDTFKVGVTRRWRLETRLREQGADRAAHVHTVSNGRIARELEAEYTAETDLVDRVRAETKVAGLAGEVDHDAWVRMRSSFPVIDEFTFSYGLNLARRPVRERVASGTVVGLKGRILVIERGGTTYAVDLRDLVGYELHPETGGRRLQASLGAFE